MAISVVVWLVINLGFLVGFGLWLRVARVGLHRDDPGAILGIRYQRREISRAEYDRLRLLLEGDTPRRVLLWFHRSFG